MDRQTEDWADKDRMDGRTDKVYLLLIPGFPDGGGGCHGDGVRREESGECKPVVVVVLLQILQSADGYVRCCYTVVMRY